MTRAARLSADTAARRETRAVTVAVLVLVAVVGLTAAQGGYFPTSWGWSTSLLLWTVSLWCVVSGRTEAQRGDVVFAGLLTLLACWVGVSLTWSDVPAQTVLEVERMLVLVSGVTALLLLVRRRDVPLLFGTVLASMTAIAAYALATRLLPDRLGTYDPIAAYRLSDPIGYWNGLGIYSAMAIVLAAGAVVHGKRRATRTAAAAAIPLLTTTLYFTYSRGAWLALALGLLVLVAATPRRLATVTSLLLAGIPTAVVVWLASREHALTHRELELDRAVDEGRRVLASVAAACLVTAGLRLVVEQTRGRAFAPRLRRLYAGTLLLSAVAAVAAVLVSLGGPVSMADRAWNAFDAAPPQTTNLNARLFSLSSNGRVELWRAAGSLYSENRLLGSGAGTFERYWQSRPDAAFKVRDAHGLYIETLAELGPVGLIALVCMLSVPVVAGLARRRSSATSPAALGAYIAYCVHAGIDWDWELSGVTLTALLIGSLLVVALRRDGPAVTVAGLPRTVIGAVAFAAGLVALGGLLGNSALARAQDAVDRDDPSVALQRADTARRLMPWSPWPWIVRGEAQLRGRALPDAAADFRRATEIDPGEWRAWLYLGMSTSGREQLRALRRAAALYPRNSEARDALRAARERADAGG